MEPDFRCLTTKLYALLSGPAGPRDWEAERHLYHEEARLVRVNSKRGRPGGSLGAAPRINVMSFDEYAEAADKLFALCGFWESETSHDAEIIGDTGQIRSGYNSRLDHDGVVTEWEGVNFIQVVRDDAGDWKVLSIVWDAGFKS
jgi:hypothetical protein